MTALTHRTGSMRIEMARVRRVRRIRGRRRTRTSYKGVRRMRICHRVGGHRDQLDMGFQNHNPRY